MPANSKHKEFERYSALYTKVRDCKRGEEAIKGGGEAYLPRLTGQSNAAYERYKQRGAFFNATGRTINALTGLMLRKDPIVEVPAVIEEDLNSITSNNLTVFELLRDCAEASLTYSRKGLLIDADEDGKKVYIAPYDALSIINWRTDVVDGEEILTMLCLEEIAEKIDEKDPFVVEEIPQIRVFELENANEAENDPEEETQPGKLVVRLYRKAKDVEGADKTKDWVQYGDDKYPQIMGARLERIPFVIIGSISNEFSPEKPILADLATLNVGHWRLEVDYKHGLHLCALPTPWAAGFDGGEGGLHIGPEKAWVSDDPQARAGYLEFTGSGLTAIKEAIERTENQMATMGSRILENQKAAQEAYQTVKARGGSDTASLSNIAATVEKGVAKALEWVARWKGKPEADISVKLTRDFIDADADPQLVTSLIAAVQAGKMSIETFLWNLKRFELIAPDKTVEEELEQIEAEDEAALERDLNTQREQFSINNPNASEEEEENNTGGGNEDDDG